MSLRAITIAWIVSSAAASLSLAAAGCSGGDDEASHAPRRVHVDEPPRPQPRRDNRYGPDGELLESDEVVAGLVLPRGLEPVLRTERRHLFTSRVPLEKMLAYFGPRLNTAEVEREGHSAVYRRATPIGARGGLVKLDVAIRPSSAGGTRVEISEIPPPPVDTGDRAKLIERLEEDLRMLQ